MRRDPRTKLILDLQQLAELQKITGYSPANVRDIDSEATEAINNFVRKYASQPTMHDAFKKSKA